MTSERWELVTKIFGAAIKLPQGARQDFVRGECKGEADLEAEVLRLLAADDNAGSFLERPAITTIPSPTMLNHSDFPAGSVVCGRFEILRFIGQGGMGQVYEALDLELKTRIALKAIQPDVSSDPRMLSRFRREVQLTRLITHPNVCRTFDIERHSFDINGRNSDITFLTMELLDGETLAALLHRKKRLTTVEALPLVLQMIDALTAAHTVGIVHRDFKPSNVLLVPTNRSPRVVVTDFGLARAVFARENSPTESVATSLSGSHGMMGTIVYMAPEQFERGEASVASDIYSLGLVMFEMVTGRRPFADAIPFAEATKRLKQPAVSAGTIVPDLDRTWDAAISRCLALEPKDRFETAKQVAEALLDSSAPLVRRLGAGAVAEPKLAHPSHRRRTLEAVAIVAVVLSLSVLVLRHYWLRAEEAKLAEGSTVLLTNIHNGTGDMRLDNTTELIRYQLLQSPYFSLMDSDNVRNTLAEMVKPADADLDPQTAREVAMRSGVRRVVFGTLSRVGDSYVLDLDIEQPDNSPLRFRRQWENHWSWNMAGSASGRGSNKDMPSGFLEAVRNSSDWIRQEIGESANDAARIDAPPEDVTTSNWEALSEFTQAERFRAERNNDAAVVALRNAVSADPNFALAYARLGDILVSLSRFTEGYAAYDKAIELGDQRLTRRERDRISGIHASDTWDYARAEEIFRDYAAYYPHDYFGWFYRAMPLMMMGRTEEAIESLRKAAEIDPARMFAPSHIARFDLILGRYDDTSNWIRHLRDHGHADDADLVEGESDFLQGRFQKSQDCFTRLTQSKDPLYRSYGHSLLTRLFSEQGKYSDALDAIETGIKEDLNAGDSAHHADKILDRAYLNCRQSQYERCLEDASAALDLDRSLQRSLSVATLLGHAAYEANDSVKTRIAADLRRVEAQLPVGNLKPLSDIVRAHVHGEVLLAEGDWQQALEEFRKADRIQAVTTEKEYLARALMTAARYALDDASARELRGEAVAAFSLLADNPALVWQWALSYPPGYLRDSRNLIAGLGDHIRSAVTTKMEGRVTPTIEQRVS